MCWEPRCKRNKSSKISLWRSQWEEYAK
jgi:hypothetical protein